MCNHYGKLSDKTALAKAKRDSPVALSSIAEGHVIDYGNTTII